jgi:YgiT-type zinc finger domain-containing protein
MKCTRCGALMEARRTDLPFKLGDTTIVVIRAVPVIECRNCTEYLLRDEDMQKVEEILEKRAASAELAVVLFAA